MEAHKCNSTAANSGDLLRRARRYVAQWKHVPPKGERICGDSSPQLVQELAEQVECLQEQIDRCLLTHEEADYLLRAVTAYKRTISGNNTPSFVVRKLARQFHGKLNSTERN